MQPERSAAHLSARASGWLSEHGPVHWSTAESGRSDRPVETSETPAPVEGIEDLEDTVPMLMTVGRGTSSPRAVSTTRHSGADPRAAAPGPVITRRSATRYDQDLLRAIFTECRAAPLAPLPAALASALLDAQYRAHRADRLARWPHAVDEIVELRGIPAGRVTVAVSDAELRLVDLDVLSGFRGQGIGSRVISDLKDLAAARGVPLRATVARHSRAQDLFPRLGLRTVGESPTDLAVEWCG